MDLKILQFRAECYRLLAACFYKPDKSWMNQDNLFENITHVLKPLSQKATNYCRQMGKYSINNDLEEMLVEYAKLFVGPFKLLAPPYGSYYLDNGKRIMGDSTMAVMDMYREFGLKIADDFKELPDHISVELEFMYYLIHKEIEALQHSEVETAAALRAAQRMFLVQYLTKFIQPFCEKIKQASKNSFYIALADCVLYFIANESVLLMPNDEIMQTGEIKC